MEHVEKLHDPLEDDFDEALVREVKKKEVLWNTSLLENKNYTRRCEAWNEISIILGRPVLDVKKRWKNMRDGVVRTLKRNHELMLQEGSLKSATKCKLFDELIFLKDFIGTQSNISSTLRNSLNNNSNHYEDYQASEADFIVEEEVDYTPRPRKRKHDSPPMIEAKVGGASPVYIEVSDEPELETKHQVSDIISRAPIVANELASENEEKRNSNWFFCQSLVETLDALPKRKNRLAKIKIQELLMNIEFDENY